MNNPSISKAYGSQDARAICNRWRAVLGLAKGRSAAAFLEYGKESAGCVTTNCKRLIFGPHEYSPDEVPQPSQGDSSQSRVLGGCGDGLTRLCRAWSLALGLLAMPGAAQASGEGISVVSKVQDATHDRGPRASMREAEVRFSIDPENINIFDKSVHVDGLRPALDRNYLVGRKLALHPDVTMNGRPTRGDVGTRNIDEIQRQEGWIFRRANVNLGSKRERS
jgi:hypothetical protein